MASLGGCLAELLLRSPKLEDNLSDMKALFKAKFGEDVDDSDE